MISEIGLLDSIIGSDTTMTDIRIFADGKIITPFSQGIWRKIFKIVSNPILLRTALANVRRKQIDVVADDLPISLFFRSMMNFRSERDAEYIIKTYADAIIQNMYYGDIDSLSARSCHPISDIFRKIALRKGDSEPDRCRTREGEDALKTLFTKGSTTITFEKGMGSFPTRLGEYLT